MWKFSLFFSTRRRQAMARQGRISLEKIKNDGSLGFRHSSFSLDWSLGFRH
jgi:hypothetical protein